MNIICNMIFTVQNDVKISMIDTLFFGQVNLPLRHDKSEGKELSPRKS